MKRAKPEKRPSTKTNVSVSPRLRVSPSASLRTRLAEAEETLRAIRTGEVDALVVEGPKGDQIYTLTGSDHVYRIIVETMFEASLTVDFDGTILFCNGQFAAMMRLPMEQIRGQSVMRFVAEPQQQVLNNVLREARTAPVRRRLVLQASDGTAVHIQLVASPLQVEAGNTICLVVNDLTELEASAQSIAVLRKQQQDLEKSEHALRQAAGELARSNRDLEEFAYVASHDLQEPLRQLRAFVQLLQEREAGRLDEKSTQFMGFIRQGAVRMSGLVNDLLVYSRVGGSKPRQETASCQVALTMAMAELEKKIDEACAKITHDELPVVSADKGQLVQLFENLLSNAIKFRRENAPPEVHLGARREGHEWQLWIKDNGIGIDPRYHNRVFELFQRLHGQLQYEGTGIGLAICKRIVERHGGKIWIESGSGEGTTVCFTLPEDRQI